MDSTQSSAAFMILGALLGSAISPASQYLFANYFERKGEKYSLNNGLVLLATANGLWVFSYLFYELFKKTQMILPVVLVMFVVSLLVFIASFLQFKKGNINNLNKNLILCLCGGNLTWLIAEQIEIIGEFTSMSNYLLWKVSIPVYVVSALILTLPFMLTVIKKPNN